MAVVKIIPDIKAITDMFELIGQDIEPSLENALDLAADIALETWLDTLESSSAKEGWKKMYREAITEEEGTSENERVLSAEGLYVNLVEDGVKSWSIKDALLNGPNAKQGKNGKYANVFLRKGVPGSKGPTMSSSVHSIAKTLGRGETLSSRIKSMSDKIGKGAVAKKKKIKALRESIKGSKDERLQKVGATGHSAYGTFLRINEKSKGWMYPNVQSVPVYEMTTEKANPQIKKIFDDVLMNTLETGLKEARKNV